MKIPMTADRFNQELKSLVQEAMRDGKMSVFEILGSLTAAQMHTDRLAVAIAQQQHTQETAQGIVPITALPPKLKNQ